MFLVVCTSITPWVVDQLRYILTTHIPRLHISKRRPPGVDTMSGEQEGPERTEMARETDTTRLPDASEERIIECPVCSNTMTTMSADGVTVDVCWGMRWDLVRLVRTRP